MTEPVEARVREDQFLGALLGMAIGDALGVPLRGMAPTSISSTHGSIKGYLTAPDPESGSDAAIGQISDKTEIALCIVESLTTNDGFLDFDNIAARMAFVARSPSRASMSGVTLDGIERSADHGDIGSGSISDPAELAAATRGVPFGLLHSIGIFDAASLRQETDLVTRLSHRGDEAALPTWYVALAVCAAARQPDSMESWLASHSTNEASSMREDIAGITRHISLSTVFEQGVFDVVSEGGDTDSRAAIAGAIAGARFGASGIPQELIDNLDARIYLSLAAPWYFRTALRRQGTVIDLRTV
ncbi:MAG: ADP-ribosylglycohydrolase family protein [Thermomicrobiales bacterium]